MQYNFDEIIERRGTRSEKWDLYPPDVLPLWVADSDFKSPVPVIEAIQKLVKRGVFGYTLADGAFERAYARWAETRYGWAADPGWVLWSPSLGAALATCIRAFTVPGERVAMLSPIYPPFINLCHVNGRIPEQSALRDAGAGYTIDFADLEDRLAHPQTKLLLLCNPHNPTGRVFSVQELERIGELCLRHKIVIFSDEIHADIIFKGRHTAFPALSKELAAITLVGMNASKTFNLADLRSAAVLSSSPELRKTFAGEIARANLGRNSLGIAGVIAAYTDCDDYADQLVPYLEANLRHAVDFLTASTPKIKAGMPESTFLLWLDCKKIGLAQPDLVKLFLERGKVALNSGISFGDGGEGFMRLNVACPRATLQEGLNRIAAALSTL
ncbi:MAG: pyridoxal phosphate-dependent aminotransferase [Desulfovibrio sp.]|nr:pyridoxal phosphate-dependent aminotransferase [Desulfovibrio sp.]